MAHTFFLDDLKALLDELLVRVMTLFRYFVQFGYTTGVWLRRALAFSGEGPVETRTCYDEFVSFGLILRRIFLGSSAFTTPYATSSTVSVLDSVELASTRTYTIYKCKYCFFVHASDGQRTER